MLLFVVLFLSASGASENITGYDPSELLTQIFNSNDTQLRGGYGLVNFDQNFDLTGDLNPNSVVFGDGDGVQGNIKKKRRRRPKKTYHQYAGGYINNGDSFYSRPVPPPSLAAQAFSSITEALTSIAKYDDYQCVPRLLCEASGGMGSQALPSVPGLESLLTLLSAYTGITTNPLFVFGRAVYLGVSSHGNPASCRYAYPQCPTDAEKLVHYLNNHNGGFFRFFNSPQQQQNLQQFYQNYQPYDQNVQPNPYPPLSPQNAGQYGLYKPNLYENQLGYGSGYNHNQYKTSEIQKRIQNKPNSNAIEDVIDTKWTFQEGNRHNDGDGFYVEDEDVENFKFPENNNNYRKTRGFAFPENVVDKQTYSDPTNDKFVFSNHNNEYNNVKYYNYNDKYVNDQKYQEHLNNKYLKEENYYNERIPNDNYNFYKRVPVNNHNNYYYNSDINEDNLQTVYVVRGNGDPNRPEIIKLKPGQSIKDF